jgi:hypothetical protein
MVRLLLLAAAIAVGQLANSMVLPALPFAIGETRVAPWEAAGLTKHLREFLRRQHFRSGVAYGSAFYFALGVR